MISEILRKYKTDKNRRIHNYGLAYDGILRHFDRNAKLDIVEIGVLYGESIKAWRECFPNANITGIDIEEDCIDKIDDVTYIIDDVRNVKPNKPFDIIIDDGNHMLKYVYSTIENFKLKVGGVMVIEDCRNPELWYEKIKERTKYSMECIDLRDKGRSRYRDNFLIVLRNYGYYDG